MKIGIFDSGFGGLDVLMGLRDALPELDYVYLGDNARVPYGNRSQETIYEYTKESLQYLFRHDCHIVIIACNTASARALRRIQQEWLPHNFPERRALGVIIPSCEDASSLTKSKRVGVIATESTVSSETFIQELKKLDSSVIVHQQACPLFVPLIEHGEDRDEIWDKYVSQYLHPFLQNDIDTLILGCTHYGIISERVTDFFKKNDKPISVVSQSDVVAKSFLHYLERHPEHASLLSKNNSLTLYITDETERFNILAKKYFGVDVESHKIFL